MKIRVLVLLVSGSPLHAGPQTSANYAIPTDVADAGGRRAASASYTHHGSMGAIAGISSVATPAEMTKAGYLGQLYDVTGFTLDGPAPSVGEGATLQLPAWFLLDDATLLAAPAADVAWSVQSGPLTGIDTAGLATAGIVYQNTPAIVQGTLLGISDTLGLTVLNTLADNFGTYAGDGLDDAWQNGHFGLDNPLAAPGSDPDTDGRSNTDEFKALTDPVSPASFFIPASMVAGPNLVISFPTVTGRTYTLERSDTLAPGSWTGTGLPAALAGDGSVRTFSVPVAAAYRSYYRVQVGL